VFILRNLMAVFDGRVRTLEFHSGRDMVADLQQAMGLSLSHSTEEAERANMRSVDALAVETTRLLNVHKYPDNERQAMVDLVSATFPASEAGWTERFPGDAGPFEAPYRKRLQRLSGLTEDAVERLLAYEPPVGSNVADLKNDIRHILQNRRPL
jgi:hypothetical protein